VALSTSEPKTQRSADVHRWACDEGFSRSSDSFLLTLKTAIFLSSRFTGLIYVPVREWGGIFFSGISESHPDEIFTGGHSQIFTDPPPKGVVRALDALTGEVRWEYHNNTTSTVGGLLSTKGGVVFRSVGQSFFVLDAKTGRELWRIDIDTGGWIKAAPVTCSIDGKQIVTIAAGHELLTFGL
jgi:alcohol dehydrogenase (cytochrome c)